MSRVTGHFGNRSLSFGCVPYAIEHLDGGLCITIVMMCYGLFHSISFHMFSYNTSSRKALNCFSELLVKIFQICQLIISIKYKKGGRT